MKSVIVSALAMFALAAPAFADSKPTADESTKIKEVLAAAGYSGGEMEKESEGSGMFEVDDAKDKSGGQFDIKLDKEFRIISITRD